MEVRIGNPEHPDYRIMAIEFSGGFDCHSAETRQEAEVAIHDVLAGNLFRPRDSAGGPYRLVLARGESGLVFEIGLANGTPHGRLLLSLTPFRRVLREYDAVCRSYHSAVRESQLARLEAVDIGRRSLHDEGAQLVIERLKGRIELDFATARRLFTLVSALCSKP